MFEGQIKMSDWMYKRVLHHRGFEFKPAMILLHAALVWLQSVGKVTPIVEEAVGSFGLLVI